MSNAEFIEAEFRAELESAKNCEGRILGAGWQIY